MEQLCIPVKGKAFPDHVAVAGIEGKDDQQHDGRIEEQKRKQHEQAVKKRIVLFHIITACSSPSPKRFITAMQITTIIIMTREIAAPSWGL